MGKGPSGAGDTPARGAGVMSISSALDAAKAEFARNVKDSEEVMETLEVTSLAEIREVSAEIVAQNRENARRALEKASATVGGGAWVSPTSGDALVAPLAGSRRAADKAKRRSSKTRDASGKDFSKDKSDGPRSANVSEPSPLAKALDSPVGVALRRAAAREPPELDAVEERSAGLRPISPAAARDGKKVLRRAPARRPSPSPASRSRRRSRASVAPVLGRAQRLRREAEERRSARSARGIGGGGQDGARAARGGARAAGRHVAAERARKARRPGRPRGCGPPPRPRGAARAWGCEKKRRPSPGDAGGARVAARKRGGEEEDEGG